ncbi:hypothetical protein [Serratia marcescens]|uniref:hypothetical protein n=1 Tax=Serratia marcescens TaxID=615 RepID=UPI0020CD6F41|nr:hypothetical protein [Serratia marcescens]
MQTIPAAVLDDLAPQGVLRAAINYGNPVLAQAGADGKRKALRWSWPPRWLANWAWRWSW